MAHTRRTPVRHLRPSDLRAAAQLVTQATLGVVGVTEGVHQAVRQRIGLPGGDAPDRAGGLTGRIYAAIRGAAHGIGAGIDGVLHSLAPLLERPGADHADSAERAAVVAALNGVFGDRLAAMGNALAQPMELRHGGQALPLHAPERLAQRLGGASPHLLLMIHGLCMNDSQWLRSGHDHTPLLAETLQATPLHLRYNSGLHIAANGRELARAMERLTQHWPVDLRGITLVGHSMGGVLARLMVSSTQGQVLASITDTYGLDPDQLDEQLRPFVEFEPVPQVSSAIFIAAPHRGTDFANNRIARWVSNLITLPFSMVEQFADLTRQLAHASPRIGKDSLLRIPNSIDNLSDADEYVRLMANLPISPRVRYHSIIGNDTPNLPLADSSDGIVPYRSAHLEGAASELIVPFSHSVQEHPRAIVEIRRILHNQLLPSNAPSKP